MYKQIPFRLSSAFLGIALLLPLAQIECFGPTAPEENGDTGDTGGTSDVTGERNSTDPTNGGASYLGSATCMSCHDTQAALHIVHGHAHKLQKINNGGPSYPDVTPGPRSPTPGIPSPPDGKTWEDITYVIGGYYRKGRFVDSGGYVMTDGVDGVNTQWNLNFPPNGTTPGWTSYNSDQISPKPYDFSCFQCHTTGPAEGGHQDSLTGMAGTFAEPGVQCEACHGPGSDHVGITIKRDKVYVNDAASACGTCHTRGSDPKVIQASGGFIRHHEQYPELLGSPHASLKCVTCHESHTSVAYDVENAIVKDCQSCHPSQNMALHSGKIFVRGDYVEVVSCKSCHMPYATKSAAAATTDVVGDKGGRMGDIRTHLFYINTNAVDYNSMFTDDGTSVTKDTAGKGSVTVDFVCLRCHSGKGNAFELTVTPASSIASEMHDYSN